MNDYLAHLAARVLAPEPAIRPRALSLFESAPAGSVAPGEPVMESRDAGGGDATSSAVDSLVAVTLNAERPAPVRPQADIRTVIPHVPAIGPAPTRSILNSRFPEPERTGEPPLAKVAIRRSAAPAGPILPLPIAAIDREANRPLKHEAASVASHVAPEIVSAAPEPIRARFSAAEDQSAAATAAALIAPILPTPTPDRIDRAPAFTTVSKTPEPPALVAPPLRLPAQRANGTAPAAGPLPAIHVTIGRLEIRAIVPPENVPRTKPQRVDSPSLEDYLRKRSGGAAR